MAHWDAIVIGSGLGGLAAATRLARAGKRALVLERLANFGGAATLYRHDGFTMEASLHAIDGVEFTSEFGALRRLGVADQVTPVAAPEYCEARSTLFPAPVRLPSGFAAFGQALADAFPDSAEASFAYAALLERLFDSYQRLEEAGAGGIGAVFSLLFSGRAFELAVESGRTVRQELDRVFGDHEAPKLAVTALLCYLDDDPAKASFLGFGMVQALYLAGGSHYLQGGSATLTLALLAAIKDAGGEARHKTAVEAILLDAAGRACGVRARGPDGALVEETAPVVFGNAAPAVLAEMLPDGRRAEFSRRYEGYAPSTSLFTVQLGLSRPPRDFGLSAYTTVCYPDWLTRLEQHPASGDVFGGPPGAAMPLYAATDYGRIAAGVRQEGEPHELALAGADRLWAWEGFDEDQDRDRRRLWVEAFVADLDRRFPGLAGAVTHAEMATARTMRNRLGTPHGETYGFRPTPQRLFGRPPSARTAIPGLWLASAYTVSGGYAGAMHGGLLAAEAALSELRRA